MSVTVGQITAIANAVPKLAADMSGAGLDLSDLSADAIVADDILGILAPFLPWAALAAELLAVAIAVAPMLPGLGIRPDPYPEVDAQTRTQGGR